MTEEVASGYYSDTGFSDDDTDTVVTTAESSVSNDDPETGFSLLATATKKQRVMFNILTKQLNEDSGSKLQALLGYLKGKLAKILMMFIIVTTEFDIIGFILSFIEYRTLSPEVELIFYIMPIGYIAAIGLYIYHAKVGGQGIFACMGVDGNQKETDDGNNEEQELEEKQKAERAMNQNAIAYYHYTPILRMSMLMRDLDYDDVMALFRVSSVSSMTLGLAQLFGFLANSIAGKELSIYGQVSIYCVIASWSITVIYFTPLAPAMARSKADESRMDRLNRDIRNALEDFNGLKDIAKCAANKLVNKKKDPSRWNAEFKNQVHTRQRAQNEELITDLALAAGISSELIAGAIDVESARTATIIRLLKKAMMNKIRLNQELS